MAHLPPAPSAPMPPPIRRNPCLALPPRSAAPHPARAGGRLSHGFAPGWPGGRVRASLRRSFAGPPVRAAEKLSGFVGVVTNCRRLTLPAPARYAKTVGFCRGGILRVLERRVFVGVWRNGIGEMSGFVRVVGCGNYPHPALFRPANQANGGRLAKGACAW